MSNFKYFRDLIKTCHDIADCAAKPLRFKAVAMDDWWLHDVEEATFQYWIRRRDTAITEYVDLLIKARTE